MSFPRIRVAVCDGPRHLNPVQDGLCRELQAAGVPHRRWHEPVAMLGDLEMLRGVEVLAGFGSLPVNAAVLDAAPALRGVVSCVSGTDGIDLAAASARGVLVAHAPTPENARSMAEAALMLLLSLSYDLDRTRARMAAGEGKPLQVGSRMLHGQTIGLVGWGRIAQLLAQLLQPFDVKLLVYSRRGAPADLPPQVRAVTLDELMSSSDAVCVLAGAVAHAPPIVDRRALGLMRPSSHLINLSRGSTVDEVALAEVLQAGRIAGAALDVFAVEPLPADSPLRRCANVILTPHHVGHTREGDASLLPALVANVMALLEGRLPPMIRNPEAIPAWQALLASLAPAAFERNPA
jgi:phosphoglycerate dehydrogenase-like enzyme